MHNFGRTHLFDQLLDHGFACQTEFVDAAFDGGNTELNAQPINQEFGDLDAREPETQRQRRNERGEHRADKASFAHLQIAPSPLDVRAQSARRTCDRLVTVVAAYRQIGMFCSCDMKVHIAAGELKVQMGADVAALRDSGSKDCMACVARLRCVQDFTADHNRQPAPEPFRSRSFASRLWSRVTPGRVAARRRTTPTGVIVPVGLVCTLLALAVTPVGIIAGRRTGTGC
ncbi:hypothetical protein AruPA_13325 [Acidiphilium sp. PA]|nr:hypothetical protein [Acidiphilium sp. PA]MCW8308023.1 hypothetical protein [Acidiphilium sp. PA]